MKILALEFSSSQRSVAVVTGGADGQSSTTSELVETGAGAMRALAMVTAALQEAKIEREEIDCLAVGLGPGSYTGIRAAISLAQGWQLALGTKLLGLSSADAIAAEAQASGHAGQVNMIIDAQRNELYLASYELSSNSLREITPLHLTTVNEMKRIEDPVRTPIGPEAARWFPNGKTVFPRAAPLGRLALTRTDYISGEKLVPIYLRATAFVKAPPARIVPDQPPGRPSSPEKP